MSLATRCTSCGTVFRVVEDQLKVSDGWVRCGRCDAVFNAAEGVFDLEHEAPPAWSPTQPPSEAAGGRAAEESPAEWPAEDERRSASEHGEAFREPPSEPDAAVAVPPVRAAATADLISTALARHADDLATPHAASRTTDRGVEPTASSVRIAAAEAPPGTGETPSASAWRPDAERGRPGRRTGVLLGGAALVLALVLAAQVAAQFSEIAVARWPALRPVLERWCGLAGCSLAAPRRIEELVVDSSSLAPVVGTEALKLGIALRSRAGFAVAVPSVDLSLTDSAGRLLARRTLTPADFQVATVAVAPGGELTLQALLTAGKVPVTGYTVQLFYP